ncbi:ribokinase [Lysobacter yangpyeongensis]|uniref:Ribokinase n=1 Tax=Lysobacter yangpyeongensis TaxID=346182 RepID=A0ABW0SHR6_9GAMM
MTSGNTVLVAGSANLDFVVRAPHIPAPGETVLGSDFSTFPGGKGANQAVACARAGGVRTRMLLALGNDAYALPLEHSLREAGVEAHIVRTGEPTGVAFICVSDEAENAITVAPGANSQLRPEHLPDLAGVTHLLLQLETPLDPVLAWAQAARAAGVRVVLNAAPAQALPQTLLESVDVLIANEGELAAVTGVEDDMAAAVARLGRVDVIVTLGARGSCAHTQGGWVLQPAFEVDAVDTTGAGDTYCGAFVAALAAGDTFAEAMRRAAAASALACTRMGAQASIPARAEVELMLAQGRELARDELRRYCEMSRGSSSLIP